MPRGNSILKGDPKRGLERYCPTTCSVDARRHPALRAHDLISSVMDGYTRSYWPRDIRLFCTIVEVDAFHAEGVGGQRGQQDRGRDRPRAAARGDLASSGQAEIAISEVQLVGS